MPFEEQSFFPVCHRGWWPDDQWPKEQPKPSLSPLRLRAALLSHPWRN